LNRPPSIPLSEGYMRITKFVFFVLVFFILSACASTGAKNASPVSGQVAPDFTLSDQKGNIWKLSNAVKNHRAVVLAFYPKDDTKL